MGGAGEVEDEPVKHDPGSRDYKLPGRHDAGRS
jgi:hypothetical protein